MSPAARRYVAVAVVVGLASSVCLVVQAVLLARVISRVFLGGAGLAQEWPALAALGLVTCVRAGLAWGSETAAHRASARAKRDLRRRLAEAVFRLGPSYLGSRPSGELIVAATRGIDALDAYFARYLPQLVLAALVPVAVLLWVLRIDGLSALILVATLPMVPLFGWLIGRAAEAPARRQWALLATLSGHFLDVVRGLPTLRLFGRSRAQAQIIGQVSEEHRRATMRTLRVAFLTAFALETVAAVATALVAVSIGLRLLDGSMTLLPGLTVLLLTPEVYLPLRQASAQFHASAEGMAAAEDIFDVLATEPQVRAAGVAQSPTTATGGEPICFEEVSLLYEGRTQPALDRITLEIRPGERLALTGPSGAGKSTVLAMLLRFTEPQAGRITVGDTDLSAIDPAAWRKNIAWVTQRPHLFRGSIEENLRIARPGASSDELVRAMELAGASEFVHSLPDGVSTAIGERGEGLSAGQRQRLAIARAFLRDAPLLLLDEPTSNLDPESEAVVAKALGRLMEGRTVVIVAHRPALTLAADRVVRLEAGRVVESPALATAPKRTAS